MLSAPLLKSLDWPLFEAKLQEYSLFPEVTLKHFITNHLSMEELKVIFDKTQFFIQLMDDNLTFPLTNSLKKLNPNGKIQKLNEFFQKEGFLSIEELNELVLGVEVVQELLSYDQNPLLGAKDVPSFHRLKHLIKHQFRSFVSEDLKIDYLKHPKLERIFTQLTKLETQIRTRLNGFISDSKYSSVLQFKGIDLIHDRYIIPIRSDAYSGSLGNVIGRSETGQTLYVEPAELHQLNNEHIDLVLELNNSLVTIAQALTLELRNFRELIQKCVELVFELDDLLTRAAFAKNCSLTRPIITEHNQMEVKNFFHPLIANPIKNSLHLPSQLSGLIISGPNTGGKTVVLKSLCLVALFAKLGLFVPASFAEVPLAEEIFFFTSDNQNLEEGLSSFSGEIKSYFGTFTEKNGFKLIFVDEIFKSTSSEEASALAVAFLEKWSQDTGTKIFLSTHHQMLKTLMHSNQQFVSSHVGFDIDHNAPTYRLHVGTPGNSYALRILSKLKVEDELKRTILIKAESILDKKQIHYEQLLQDVAQKNNQLEKVLNENNELNKQLKNLKNAQESSWRLRLNEMVDEHRSIFDKIMKEKAQQFEQLETPTSKKLDLIKAEGLKEISSFGIKPSENKENLNLKHPAQIIEGNYYYYPQLKKDVVVLSLDGIKREAQVSIGNFKLKCSYNDLYISNRTKSDQKVVIHVEKSTPSSLSLDARGMRLEEFQNEVDKMISDLCLDLVPFINIIHGHGEGILKRWLRDYLKKFPQVKMDDDDSGNDGQTRIIKS